MEQVSGLPEFVGSTVFDTIGLVIPGADSQLLGRMGLPETYGALGLISSRTGASGQITAADDAVKSTNTELLTVELPRDTKGGGGHGCYVVIGGQDVADVRRAVELTLELTARNAGGIYVCDAGHLEFAFSARAGQVLHRVFGIPEGQAFGFMAGCPAAIGMVMADRAVKAAEVTLTRYLTPDHGTSHTNEVILIFTGHTSAVETALHAGRAAGLALLRAMGQQPRTMTAPLWEEL